MNRVRDNAHSVAVAYGFGYIDNEAGKPHDAIPDVWMSAFTRDAARTGPKLYVGWMRLGQHWLIEWEEQPNSAADLLPSKIGLSYGFSVRRLSTREGHTHFYVKRVKKDAWVLRCVEVTERARWGNRAEMLADLQKALDTACLPGPQGRWGL